MTAAFEGATDEPVARRLLAEAGLALSVPYPQGGKDELDRRLAGYNNAAKGWYWLVLRDLDRDADCAPALSAALLPQPAAYMLLSIAVRQVEAWLLGDVEGMAEFLKVPRTSVPTEPELLPDAKRALVRLAGTSRSSGIRQDMVPARGSTARVGPLYVARVEQFCADYWRPAVSAAVCPSLARCLDRLREWASTAQPRAHGQRSR